MNEYLSPAVSVCLIHGKHVDGIVLRELLDHPLDLLQDEVCELRVSILVLKDLGDGYVQALGIVAVR